MTLAGDARETVRRHPYLVTALRAGVVNFAAAARSLEVSDDTDAVAAALRRMADRLPDLDTRPTAARVTMRSGVESDGAGELLAVGGAAFDVREGLNTAIVATGEIDAAALEHVLGVCRVNDIDVVAGGMADGELVLVVDRRDGPHALRLVESALEAVPR